MRNTTFRTKSGTVHIIVTAPGGEYYGRFSGRSVMLFRMASHHPRIVTGKSVRLPLLRGNGEPFTWISTPVQGTVVNRSFPTQPEARVVTAYAEYQESLLPVQSRKAE